MYAEDDQLESLITELPRGSVITDPDATAGYCQDEARQPNAGTPIAVVRTTCLWDPRRHSATTSGTLPPSFLTDGVFMVTAGATSSLLPTSGTASATTRHG